MSHLRFWSLTIDKCQTDKYPTREDYKRPLERIMEKGNLSFTKWKVSCFEYKHKSDKFPKWLHYHALLYNGKANRINFKEIQTKGFSIRLDILPTQLDVGVWCGYCQKDKLDKSLLDIIRIKPTFKKDKKIKPRITFQIKGINLPSDSD